MIQRWTGQLLPPELVGSHIGDALAHTTGRTHTMGMRAASSVFSHLGIESDLTKLSDAELAELGSWIRYYKARREFLAGAATVRSDSAPDGMWVHGLVSHDRSFGVFVAVQMQSPDCSVPGLAALPGLDPHKEYSIRIVELSPEAPARSHSPVPWIASGGILLSGRELATVGLQMPALFPEQSIVLELTETNGWQQ